VIRSISLKQAALGAALFTATAAPALAQDAPLKLGVVTFLSGPAAATDGIPGREAVELLIEAINKGTLPAPYGGKGLAGRPIEAVYLDEAGGTATQVSEYRNMVERAGVEAVMGYVSSGTCLAVAPLAEELKTLTIFATCGTQRLYEEGSYDYVYRTSTLAYADAAGAARYLIAEHGKPASISGVNQNYAWGQDSWADFVRAMAALAPEAEVGDALFPKLFAGQYGAEISALTVSGADAVFSSMWGGDLESFLIQASARGLPQRIPFLLSVGEALMSRFKDQVPDGLMIGARGPNGALAEPSALNEWFVTAFTERFGVRPNYTAYYFARPLLALKAAAAKAGNGTDLEALRQAMTGITFQGIGTEVSLTRGKGHQATTAGAWGRYRYDAAAETAVLDDIQRFPASCINPPDPSMSGSTWLEKGMPGAEC